MNPAKTPTRPPQRYGHGGGGRGGGVTREGRGDERLREIRGGDVEKAGGGLHAVWR